MSNREKVIQFLKFCLVGATNTGIYLLTYYGFIYYGTHYLVANIIGFIVSVLNGYYWSRKYVFAKKNTAVFKQLIKTYVSYGATTIVSTCLLYVLVELNNVSQNTAPLLTLLITIPLNFLLNKYWAFK